MTGITKIPDFRMLTIMRAAMRSSPAGVSVLPAQRYSKEKRRGMRRVWREIARPFERFAKACRKRLETGAYSPGRSPPAPPPPVRAL